MARSSRKSQTSSRNKCAAPTATDCDVVRQEETSKMMVSTARSKFSFWPHCWRSKVPHLVFVWMALSGCMAFVSGCGLYRNEIVGEVGVMLVTMLALYLYHRAMKSLRLELASPKVPLEQSGKDMIAASLPDHDTGPVQALKGHGDDESTTGDEENSAAVPEIEIQFERGCCRSGHDHDIGPVQVLKRHEDEDTISTTEDEDISTTVPKIQTKVVQPTEVETKSMIVRPQENMATMSDSLVPSSGHDRASTATQYITQLFDGKVAWADIDSDDDDAFPEWRHISGKTAAQSVSQASLNERVIEPEDKATGDVFLVSPDSEKPHSIHETQKPDDAFIEGGLQVEPHATGISTQSYMSTCAYTSNAITESRSATNTSISLTPFESKSRISARSADVPLHTSAAPFVPASSRHSAHAVAEPAFGPGLMPMGFGGNGLLRHETPETCQDQIPARMFGVPLAMEEQHASSLCSSYSNSLSDASLVSGASQSAHFAQYSDAGWGAYFNVAHCLNAPSNFMWDTVPQVPVVLEQNAHPNMYCEKPLMRENVAEGNGGSMANDDFSDSDDEIQEEQRKAPLTVPASRSPVTKLPVKQIARNKLDWEAATREVRCLNALDLPSTVRQQQSNSRARQCIRS